MISFLTGHTHGVRCLDDKEKDEPYQDPRQLPKGDAEPAEPSVIVEDVIEMRPGGDRPPKDDPEDVEGRPPATIPEVIKRPLVD